MDKTGLIQIYTGTGKGKTTAACGLAVRANARGFKVCWMSFHKDPKYYRKAEQQALRKLGITVRYLATEHPMCAVRKNSSLFVKLRGLCLKGLKAIRKIYKENKFDLLVLDELNISVRDGFLKENDVLEIMQEKPKNLELVITGRGATRKMINKADLVSLIKERKHPYKKGVAARKGIEY